MSCRVAVWTLASTAWASDAASAFSEFDRVSLYLGVFALCSLVFRRRDLAAWCDGIGFGIVAVAVVALCSRAFPGIIGRESGAAIFPALTSRLSYPVGYWNGLGILCGPACRSCSARRSGQDRDWCGPPQPGLCRCSGP